MIEEGGGGGKKNSEREWGHGGEVFIALDGDSEDEDRVMRE